jgi:hypothetical protein
LLHLILACDFRSFLNIFCFFRHVNNLLNSKTHLFKPALKVVQKVIFGS